jgi:hypothetical protein
VARKNYGYEKRKRETAKRKKREAKRLRKKAKREGRIDADGNIIPEVEPAEGAEGTPSAEVAPEEPVPTGRIVGEVEEAFDPDALAESPESSEPEGEPEAPTP